MTSQIEAAAERAEALEKERVPADRYRLNRADRLLLWGLIITAILGALGALVVGFLADVVM
jgi:hypothetical protein